ncbi:MAG: enoyl-CoA hydratase-related protein [Hyphomicrobiales bacterium]|nr:enoyl-CoA hydratase-related protein [Hyphomicrobiales bacterium]
MNTYETLLVERRDAVAIVTINRPKALNALNAATVSDLSKAIAAIGADPSIRVVIITGSGEKAFVAGADITEMQAMSASEGRAWGRLGQQVFASLEALPQPVIAAVNGFALGGGCELAMACDIRIAAENARFGQPESGLGITPGFGGTQRLPRLVGAGRAKELLFTADVVDAAEAYRIGLVNKVVPVGRALEEALAMAAKIMARSPVAVGYCKAAVEVGMNVDLASAIAYEAELFGLCFAAPDQKEGMTAFVEKRKPVFG